MSKRNTEPGWHEPIQDAAGDEWEEELTALHETVVRVVEGTETPISPHVTEIPNGREGLPLDADVEARSNTLNTFADDSAPANDGGETPAIMRVFNAGTGFVKDNAAASAATAVAAAGIGWLIWSSRATPGPAPALDGVGQSIKDAASGAADHAKSASSSLMNKVKDAGGGVVDKVKDVSGGAVDSVKETGGNAVEGVKSMTSNVLESVKSAGSDAVRTASTAVGGAAHKVGSSGKEQAKRVGIAALGVAKSSPIELALTIASAAWLYRSARPEPSLQSDPSKLGQLADQAKTSSRTALHAIEGMVQKSPLAAGAIALALGAAVGLLIPELSVENRVMGPKHDELMDKAIGAAQEFTEDLTGKVIAVATEAVHSVKEEAKNQGLVPSDGTEIAPADDAETAPANAI